MKYFILKLICQIVYKYKVNIYKHPKYLSNNGKYCELNCKVALIVIEINSLIKLLKKHE